MKPSVIQVVMVASFCSLLGCGSESASPEGSSGLPGGESASLPPSASTPDLPSSPSAAGESAQTTVPAVAPVAGARVHDVRAERNALSLSLLSTQDCQGKNAAGQTMCVAPTYRIAVPATESSTTLSTVLTPVLASGSCSFASAMPVKIEIPGEDPSYLYVSSTIYPARIRRANGQAISSMTISVPQVNLVGELSRDCTIRLDIGFNQEHAPANLANHKPAIAHIDAENGTALIDILSPEICPTQLGPNAMRDCWWPAWEIQTASSGPRAEALRTQLTLVTEGDCANVKLPIMQLEVPGEWPRAYSPTVERTTTVQRSDGQAIDRLVLSGRGMLPVLSYSRDCKMSIRVLFNEISPAR